MRVLCAFLVCFLVFTACAQKIENLKATFGGGKVIVRYDLVGGHPQSKFNIELFASHNNYAKPLNFVAGDVGKHVAGGAKKEILWEAGKELGTFKGELSFKVKVEVLPLPFAFINPANSSSVRRGKSTSIQWEGGVPGQTIKLEVYRGNERVAGLADTKNTGQYNWSVPKDFEKGTDYTLRISDGGQTVTSGSFGVKAKLPLILKLSPLIIGAAIIPFLGGGGGGSEILPVDEILAAAPSPN